MSRHSHPPGIAGPGVRAVGELSQHAEHARSMQPALSFSTVMNKQKLDQGGGHVEGSGAAADDCGGLVLVCGV